MTRLFIGHKAGVGAVVKVMQNDADDPLTTPNTDWHKFRFNSEIQSIAYSYERTDWDFVGADWWSACPTGLPSILPDVRPGPFAYWPSGAVEADCLVAVEATHDSASAYRRFGVVYALDRMTDLSVRTILLRAHDRSEWSSSWKTARQNYPGSSDARYFSHSLNDVPTTTRPVTTTTDTLDVGRVLRCGTPFSSWTTNGNVPRWYHALGGSVGGAWVTSTEFAIADMQVYGTAKGALDYTEDRIVFTELPIENDPYPATEGTFSADKLIVRINPGEVKIAKPGYDVDTATREQLLVSSDKVPMKVVAAGSFTLAAGATLSVPTAYAISPRCVVETQVNVTGQTLLLPPYPDNNVDEIALEHRVVPGAIEFRNQSAVSLDCRFFVLADDVTPATTGSAKVLEKLPDGATVIRRPGAAGTVDRDILIDTRATYLPVVAQGWVGVADITLASDVTRYGTHRYPVSFSNGGFKPLVMARAKFEIDAAPGYYVWSDFFAKNIEYVSVMSSSTFLAKVTDTLVTFYVDRDSTRTEDEYNDSGYIYRMTPSQMTFIGFRYYIFACPASL